MRENYVFRLVNPRDDEDMKQYLNLQKNLSDFLNSAKNLDDNRLKWERYHLGALEYVFPEDYDNKELPNWEENSEEFAFVCEKNGEFLGFVHVINYHVVDRKRIRDDGVGVISDIFVKKEVRGQTLIALKLLKMGINKLMEHGKYRALCNVQEDNEFKFLHFVMADGNVVKQDKCKRRDGSETIDYTLMIDLKKLMKEIEEDEFLRKVGKRHLESRKSENYNLTI